MHDEDASQHTRNEDKSFYFNPRWRTEGEILRAHRYDVIRRIVVLVVVFGLFLGSAIYISKSRLSLTMQIDGQQQDERTHEPRLRNCGNSSSEAEALGCRFQLWSYAWVPEPCFDPVLEEDWLEMQPQPSPTGWQYFEDFNGTRVVDVDVVLRGRSDKLYTTWGQHLWHCAFTWRKVLRSLNGSGVKLTERDLQYGHTEHCSDMAVMANDWDFDVINDLLTLGFLECRV